MNLELERVDSDKRATLERLLQFELYEVGLDPGADGLIDWGEPLDRFFAGSSCVPLFLKLDGEVAGFVLLKLERELTGADGTSKGTASLIAEFYVMRPHRRKGVGRHAVGLILEGFPGRWVVTTWPDAVRVAFWRHAVTGRRALDVREFGPGEHKGFPGQYVWDMEPTKSNEGHADKPRS